MISEGLTERTSSTLAYKVTEYLNYDIRFICHANQELMLRVRFIILLPEI